MRGRFDGGKFAYDGRGTSGLVVLDPATGEVKKRKEMPYPNAAGALATAGGLIVTALLDGTIVALDDQTLEELWSFNVGTGVNAHPITYAVDGKQYIAIATGLTRNQIGRIARPRRIEDTLAKNATDAVRVRALIERRDKEETMRNHTGHSDRARLRAAGERRRRCTRPT